jgi:hypothetical protein
LQPWMKRVARPNDSDADLFAQGPGIFSMRAPICAPFAKQSQI